MTIEGVQMRSRLREMGWSTGMRHGATNSVPAAELGFDGVLMLGFPPTMVNRHLNTQSAR